MSKNTLRRPHPPAKCNVLGISYRRVSIGIAGVLLVQCLCVVITYSFREQVPCSLWRNGIDSLIFQHGDDNWALTGLLLACLCLCTNTALLMGAIYRIPNLVLLWYLGGVSQFVYLISFQIFCLYTKSCHRCENQLSHEARRYYKTGFGLCLFITVYFFQGTIVL